MLLATGASIVSLLLAHEKKKQKWSISFAKSRPDADLDKKETTDYNSKEKEEEAGAEEDK